MRETTKKREYCKCCGRITYGSEYKYTCDYCKKELEGNEFPQMKVFLGTKNIDTHDYDFCNWECFLSFLSKAKLSHFDFISLPCIKEEDLAIMQKWLEGL